MSYDPRNIFPKEDLIEQVEPEIDDAQYMGHSPDVGRDGRKKAHIEQDEMDYAQVEIDDNIDLVDIFGDDGGRGR